MALFALAGLAGPGWLDRLARTEPSPRRRSAQAALALGRPRPGRPPERLAVNLALQGDPRAAALIRLGLFEEAQGRRPQAHLWYALDAHGRYLTEIALAHESEATRPAGGGSTSTDVNALLPNYDLWRAWARGARASGERARRLRQAILERGPLATPP